MDINSPDRIKNGLESVLTTSAAANALFYVPRNLYSDRLKQQNGGKDYNEVMLNTISRPITIKPPSINAGNKPIDDAKVVYPGFLFQVNNPDGSTKRVFMNSKDLNKARAQIELSNLTKIAQPTVEQKARIYELKVFSHSTRYSHPGVESLAKEVITDEMARGNLITRADGKIVGKEYEFKDPLPPSTQENVVRKN